MVSLAPATTQRRSPVTELRLPPSLAQQEQLELRRAAFAQLDPMVRRQLARLGGVTPVRIAPATIYDAIYPASPAIGGHWDASWTAAGFFTHTICSYAVSLAFDGEGRPLRFIVEGAATVESDGVDEAALARALQQASQRGPLRTTAPHALTGFGL